MQHGGDPGSLLCARRAVVGLVSLAEVSNRILLSRYHARRDVTRSRGVVLGPLAGSYRSCVRDVVTLVGRSAGLRMCGKVGVWREIICNLDQLCLTLQVICTPPTIPPPWGSHLSNMLPAFLLLAYEQSLWDRTTLSVPI